MSDLFENHIQFVGFPMRRLGSLPPWYLFRNFRHTCISRSTGQLKTRFNSIIVVLEIRAKLIKFVAVIDQKKKKKKKFNCNCQIVLNNGVWKY